MKRWKILRKDVKVVVVKGPVCQGSLVDSDHMLRPRLEQFDRSEVRQPVLQLSTQPILCIDRRYASGVWTQVYKRPVEYEKVFEEAHAVIWMLAGFKGGAVVAGLQALQLRRQLVRERNSTLTGLKQACEKYDQARRHVQAVHQATTGQL